MKSWALSVDLPISKIYKTEALKKHFAWTIENDEFDDNFDYLETSLDCIVGDRLLPVDLEFDVEEKEEKPSKKIKKTIKVAKPKAKITKKKEIDIEEEEEEEKPLEDFKPKEEEELSFEEIDEIRKIIKFCRSRDRKDFDSLSKTNQKLLKVVAKVIVNKKSGGNIDLAEKIIKF